MKDYVVAFNELVKETNANLDILIHFVDEEILTQDGLKILDVVGLEYSELINFRNDSSGYATGSQPIACTICYRLKDKFFHIIAMSRSNHAFERFITIGPIIRYCSLIHELGHVDDIRRKESSNFKFTPIPSINLVDAEAYAEQFTLEYLHKLEDVPALAFCADRIYKMNKSKKSYDKDLFASVCNLVGKGRLKRWANSI